MAREDEALTIVVAYDGSDAARRGAAYVGKLAAGGPEGDRGGGDA